MWFSNSALARLIFFTDFVATSSCSFCSFILWRRDCFSISYPEVKYFFLSIFFHELYYPRFILKNYSINKIIRGLPDDKRDCNVDAIKFFDLAIWELSFLILQRVSCPSECNFVFAVFAMQDVGNSIFQTASNWQSKIFLLNFYILEQICENIDVMLYLKTSLFILFFVYRALIKQRWNKFFKHF